MTISFVAATQIPAAPATGSSPDINTTGATLLLFCQTWFGGGNNAPTDSYSNTWTGLTMQSDGSINSSIWFAFPTSGQAGSGHTFTANVSNAAAQVLAFSGTVQTGYDQTAGGNVAGPSTTYQVGSITPSANGAVIISGISWNTWTSTASIGSGFTISTQNTITGGYFWAGAAAYLIQATAAAINPTWTTGTGGNNYSGTNVSFLAAGGGGGGGTLDNSGTSIFVIG